MKLRAIVVFREVLEDDAISEAVRTLRHLETGDSEAAVDAFARLRGRLFGGDLLGCGWRSRVAGGILTAGSVFAKQAETGEMTDSVREQGRRDLETLRRLFDLTPEDFTDRIFSAHPELREVWSNGWPQNIVPGEESPRRAVAEEMESSGNWAELTGLLEGYFAANGSGVFGRYRAFRWEDEGLKPVPEPDATLPKDLVGYEVERAALTRNTERFVRGVPAQHALLYGPPGTGKSSTVKAVFNAHSEAGLRLVEVGKERLSELPRLLEVLRGRGLRFIVYVDDLSFEEDEVEYKSLKALIEGSIESPPENVRVYATSNRRNLIRESFSEREGDDVHAKDTIGEKLSLAARFGLRITFPNPDQNAYLDIVRGIARERGLSLSGEEMEALEDTALRRERWSSSRNGRAARQAVDDFEAARADPGA